MSNLFPPRNPLHTAPGPNETLHLEGILRSWHPRPRATLHPSGGNERVRFGDWTVSMEGIGVVVTTESPVASMHFAHDRVQEGRAIGDRYLLAMTASSGIPVHVDWEDAFIVRLDGQEHVEGDFWPTTLDIPEVEPPAAEAFAALCKSDALTDALILFREALAARAEDRPGIDLFLGLAVEHLVADVLPAMEGAAHQGSTWTALEKALQVDHVNLRLLYASLQIGRHRDASRQRAWLQETRQTAMTLDEKVDGVRALIQVRLARSP